MALPKLNNDNPIYETIIPSTKETVKFRPFLVKEQKNLLIAMESKDTKQILNAMLGCIESCSSLTNVKKLATFDVDYMFTQIRSKSVGETSDIVTECTSCKHNNTVKIDLSQIKMDTDSVKDTVIPLNDQISVTMQYPSYEDMMKNNSIFSEDGKAIDVILDTIVSCIHSVQTEDENVMIKDEPKEEVENFINSLTTEQLDKINAFVDSMPTLEHQHDYTCENCGENKTLILRGLQDFF